MTTSVNVNRQTVLVAERAFSYDDFTSGTAKAMIYLKPGTTILRGFMDITTAFANGSTATMSVGDTEGVDDVDRYIVATNVATGEEGIKKFTIPPVTDGEISTAEAVTMTGTFGAACTAGAGRLVIEYIESPRVTEYHAYRG